MTGQPNVACIQQPSTKSTLYVVTMAENTPLCVSYNTGTAVQYLCCMHACIAGTRCSSMRYMAKGRHWTRASTHMPGRYTGTLREPAELSEQFHFSSVC